MVQTTDQERGQKSSASISTVFGQAGIGLMSSAGLNGTMTHIPENSREYCKQNFAQEAGISKETKDKVSRERKYQNAWS